MKNKTTKIYHLLLWAMIAPFAAASHQASFKVSLRELPSCVDVLMKSNDKAELTLPDLHGNSLKFLNALIALGVVNFDQNNYQLFADTYFKEQTNLNKNDVEEITRSISKIKATNKSTQLFVRLIGDEFSDRGSNDYYTLLLLERIGQLGIKFEFILSNHGFEFIESYERGDFFPHEMQMAFAMSLIRLNNFIGRGLVSKNDINNIIRQFYKPNLKVLSYSVTKDQKTIVIYTHAPVGLTEIEQLANELNIPYKDESATELAQTIDEINKVFQTKYVQQNKVTTIFNILEPFLWNRKYDGLVRPSTHNQYSVKFVHGHDGTEKTENNIYNIDHNNSLGKANHYIEGKHQIFVFQDQ